MKMNHMILCGVLLVAGVALLASGAGTLAFVPVVACMVMMGGMMFFMTRGNSGDSDRKTNPGSKAQRE
jgi:hypothetical protein